MSLKKIFFLILLKLHPLRQSGSQPTSGSNKSTFKREAKVGLVQKRDRLTAKPTAQPFPNWWSLFWHGRNLFVPNYQSIKSLVGVAPSSGPLVDRQVLSWPILVHIRYDGNICPSLDNVCKVRRMKARGPRFCLQTDVVHFWHLSSFDSSFANNVHVRQQIATCSSFLGSWMEWSNWWIRNWTNQLQARNNSPPILCLALGN